MRLAIVICVACIFATPTPALAKPRIAVVPIEGDKGDRVGDLVADAMNDNATVVSSSKVTKAMDKLALSGELSTRDVRKLSAELDVDAVVHGRVEKEDDERVLQLKVAKRGKKPENVTIRYKSASSETFKKDVRNALSRRLDEVGEEDPEDERDRDKDRDKDKDVAEGDGETKVKKKKKKRRSEDGEGVVAERNPLTASGARGAAGVLYGLRRLSYTGAMAMNPPPPVATGAPAARIEGEIYPLVLAGTRGPAGGLGLFGSFDKAIGLSIAVPTANKSASIDQMHYAIGARYRLPIGTSAAAAGIGYYHRRYIADRSSLTTPGQLDMPDVAYKAVVITAGGHIAAAPTVAIVLDTEVLLVMDTGKIQEKDSFGAADVFGFSLNGGVDIAVAKQLAIRIGAELTQIKFTFTGNGDQTMRRGVTAATDRTIGITATLAATY